MRQLLAGLAQADPRKKAPACQGLNEPPAGGMGAGGMRVVAGMKLCLAVMVPPQGLSDAASPGASMARRGIGKAQGQVSGRDLEARRGSNLPARRGPNTDRSLRWRQARELNPRRPLS